MSLSSKFAAHLCQRYPGLQPESLDNLIAPNLLSPYSLTLDPSIRGQVEETIQAFQELRQSTVYQAWAQQKWGPMLNPGNQGLFMSYDFHVTPEGSLKLIEINTNASFLGLGWEMFQMFGVDWNADFQLEDLKRCMEKELELAQLGRPLQSVVITDEKPSEQKLYVEFLLFREVFKSWNLKTEIADIQEASKLRQADLIYNRTTDFYFEAPETQALKEIYESKAAVVSPQPYEYRLLADKENFIHWTSDAFWSEVSVPQAVKEKVQSVLPQTRLLNETNRDDIWSGRKHLFFKPKRAFGSKMSFKGGSISRKVFDELLQVEALAQELIPAPEAEFNQQMYKYDLRCYAYRDKFQGCVARLYQGQVTNLRAEGGGFACIHFR